MESVKSQLKLIREKRPVIQSITNPVTVNDCANVLLAVGASPIMAHHIKEVDEVQRRASGLVVNLGATDDYESILLAVKAANETNHPVVLDPVGVATSTYRREFALRLLSDCHIDCIRGNYLETLALAQGFVTGNGLDSFEEFTKDKIEKYVGIMQEFSKTRNTLIVGSGENDYLIDATEICAVESGDPIMKHVTGMGCMYTEVVCAFLSEENSLRSANNAAKLYGLCGEMAAEKTKTLGTIAFRNQFINEISLLGCLAYDA